MPRHVAINTQCDQVVAGVISKFASRLNVVDLQIDGSTALLATPSVSHQHLSVKLGVVGTLELNARALLTQFAHADFRSWDENVCFSGSGSNS